MVTVIVVNVNVSRETLYKCVNFKIYVSRETLMNVILNIGDQ